MAKIEQLTSTDAASYCGISVYTLRNLRQADEVALREGKPQRGPQFHRVGRYLVYYDKASLDRWLRARERARARAGRATA